MLDSPDRDGEPLVRPRGIELKRPWRPLPLSVAVLVGIVVGAITVPASAARRNRRYPLERLDPSIEV